jgi:hypothetical protein
MVPEMRWALLICVGALTLFTAWLVNYRRRLVRLEQLACRLERQAQPDC